MSSTLPSILDIKPSQDVENMNIKTEVLDPITITQSQAVFQLPKTGILDGGSMLQLGVLAGTDHFFPLATGCHSVIKSCFLKIGGKVLASNDDYAYYTTMTRQFETPEHRAYIDMVKSGASGDRFGATESGRIIYRDLEAHINATATHSEFKVPEFLRPTQNESTTPLFSIPLSTLIPMMRSRKLPLMSMKEHVYLEVNFNSQSVGASGAVCCLKSGGTDTGVTIATNKVKFISDHLYYSDPKMSELVAQTQSQNGLSVLYEDLVTTNANVPSSGVAGGSTLNQTVERQIAVSGKTVRSVMVSEKNTNANHNLYGHYFSKELEIPSQYNFRINDQRIYDRNVVHQPHKYEELAQVMGKPLMVPNQLYSFDADTDKEALPLQGLNQNSVCVGKVEGYQLPTDTNTAMTSDIRGTAHYYGYDATKNGLNTLGNGVQVGVKPITLQRTYTRKTNNDNDSGRQMRIFTNIEKIVVIKNGEVLVTGN